MTSALRVLLVDDEPDLQELLVFNLTAAGFVVEAVNTAQAGLDAARRERPHVVILDVMLPDLAGTEVCRQLRADSHLEDVGIVMLTARGDESDRVLGFEVGADDYVVKPYSVRELVLRVKALARRSAESRSARAVEDAGSRLVWRGLSVDPVRHRVFIGDSELSLRPLEYKLLSAFMEHPGIMFSRAELLEMVWGIKPDTHTRTVDTHIRRLRERLGVFGDAIETVQGFGYRLRNP
ncbi:MAG: response regulator [Polyangiaceae bacterium]|nr:response regulator [Polyangiaceae bacterium]